MGIKNEIAWQVAASQSAVQRLCWKDWVWMKKSLKTESLVPQGEKSGWLLQLVEQYIQSLRALFAFNYLAR